MRRNTSTIEYLAFLSAKYDVDPDRLFRALIAAAKNGKSACEDLSVDRRDETSERVMFLITKASKVVAQFSACRDLLLKKDHPIRDFMKTDKIHRFLAKKARQSRGLPIKDLRSGMTQVCLKARIVEIPEPRLVYTRYGNFANVSNVLIADETGTIRLCLWNEQISCISAGDTVQIENARASTFRGQKQLNIGRRGHLSNVGQSKCQVEAFADS